MEKQLLVHDSKLDQVLEIMKQLTASKTEKKDATVFLLFARFFLTDSQIQAMIKEVIDQNFHTVKYVSDIDCENTLGIKQTCHIAFGRQYAIYFELNWTEEELQHWVKGNTDSVIFFFPID